MNCRFDSFEPDTLHLWFGHLFKVFRSVSLDLTGYVYIAMVHLKLVNLFVEKQVMLSAIHYWTLKVRVYVVKIYFLPK